MLILLLTEPDVEADLMSRIYYIPVAWSFEANKASLKHTQVTGYFDWDIDYFNFVKTGLQTEYSQHIFLAGGTCRDQATAPGSVDHYPCVRWLQYDIVSNQVTPLLTHMRDYRVDLVDS